MKTNPFNRSVLLLAGVAAAVTLAPATSAPPSASSEVNVYHPETNTDYTRQYFERVSAVRAPETESQREDALRAFEKWYMEQHGAPSGFRVIVTPVGLNCFIGLIAFKIEPAYKPLPSQAFDAWLFDPDGKAVCKTREGRRGFGRPLVVDAELLDPLHHQILSILRDERTITMYTGGDAHIWDLDLLKSFRIKKPGPHRLEVQVRLFVKDTNGVFQPLFLPRVERVVNVRERDVPAPIPWGDILVYGGALSLCALGLGWLIWRTGVVLPKNSTSG